MSPNPKRKWANEMLENPILKMTFSALVFMAISYAGYVLNSIDQRLGKLEDNVSEVEGKQDALMGSISELKGKSVVHDSLLKQTDKRVDKLEANYLNVRSELKHEISNVESRLRNEVKLMIKAQEF